jgi:isopropylmalate/homocitrate/citramalate synthase
MDATDLIYDWNAVGPVQIDSPRRVTLNDETLRDGLQSPSVRDPTIAEKIEILHLMEDLAIEAVDIGLPGAGPRAYADTEALALEIARARLKIRPNCAARTYENDIRPIAEISQRAGIGIEAAVFLGASPMRRFVEQWSVDHVLEMTEKAVLFAAGQGLPVMYVTEDTSRTDPETVRRLYTAATDCGAGAIALCDTVGHATPVGAYNLVRFVHREIVAPCGRPVRIDWHGHNDRGLGVANSLAAVLAGADQVHGAANALGERVGNTAMELLLVNLRLLGWIDRDLSPLKRYCETVARATGTAIPPNAPVVGRDAFRTATGVHAAAIVKALARSDARLADAVYSGVPARLFGLEQIIEIGPLSGRSNVQYWLARHEIPVTEERVSRIFQAAKNASRVLTDEEIYALCGQPEDGPAERG